MLAHGDEVLLCIFIGDGDIYEDAPLSEAIVREARQGGVAHATMLRGGLVTTQELSIVRSVQKSHRRDHERGCPPLASKRW
jgi:PII-like signaling protein